MKNLKSRILVKIVLFSLLLSYGGCSDKTHKTKNSENQEVVAKSKQATLAKPKPIIFEFLDSKGKKIKITFDNQKLKFDNFPNKIVMVDFFGKHCPPCLAEIPHLVDIQKKYQKEFVILGIHVQERMNVFERANFIKTHHINYSVVDDDKAWPFVDFIQQATGWKGSIPFMLIFTPKGEIFTYYNGMTPQEMIEGDLKKLLNQYPKQKEQNTK